MVLPRRRPLDIAKALQVWHSVVSCSCNMEKLKGLLGGNAPIPRSSPLRCLLAHWKQGNFGQDLCRGKLIDYCNTWWPEYVMEGGEKWPVHGTLQHNSVLQLMLFCKHKGRWDEVPYIDLFFYL